MGEEVVNSKTLTKIFILTILNTYTFFNDMLHTLNIYRHLYKNLPPLFPPDKAEEIRQAIAMFEQPDNFELKNLEKKMIEHGFLVWPYYQTHKEFLERTIDELGDHFLEPILSESVLEKYREFKGYGGNWRALYSGEAADFFETEERLEISRALIEAKNKLKDFVKQEILGLRRDKYLRRVDEYNLILREVESELSELRNMAAQEDHRELSRQIEVRIEAIEHSFAHLGQELQHHEIMTAVEFFQGRKKELSRLRGIDIPRLIDFHNTD